MGNPAVPGPAQDNTATGQPAPGAPSAPPSTPPATTTASAATPPANPPAAPAGTDSVTAKEPAKDGEFTSMLTGKSAEGEKPKGGQEGAKADAPADDFDVVLPEGSRPDGQAVDFIKGLVKDKTVSKEVGQKLANEHMAAVQRMREHAIADGQKQIDAWESEIRAHPKYGGVHFDQSVDNAKLVLQKYGSPKLLEDFGKMGVLSHSEFVYMLLKVHADTSEGTSIGGAGQSMPEKNVAKILYPNLN